jgi:transcriptional regulator with XRE-family HTH domain
MAKYPEFGRLLRQARIEKDLRQQDVALEIDVNTEYYARIERGKALGAVDTFAVLRAFLGFDANPLIAALGSRSKPVPRRRRAPIQRAAPVLGSHSGFGQLLKLARMERDLTQTGVATAIGRTPHHYTLIEVGQKLPSMKTFAKLQHCLGFDANAFLDALISVPKPFAALGQLLAHARKGKGKTIAEVAVAMGCTAEHYWRLEAGAELPTIMMFVRLHRVLGFGAGKAVKSIPTDPDVDPGELWTPHYEFGRLLKLARVERDMLLSDVVKSTGSAARYYARLEAGICLPSIEHLAKLHDCLGFDANQLLRVLIHAAKPFTEFGLLLIHAREDLEMKPKKVAETVGCDVDHYERIESGIELPTTMMLARLHEVLGFDVDAALRTIAVESGDER